MFTLGKQVSRDEIGLGCLVTNDETLALGPARKSMPTIPKT
jgi:hypothetical protein